jgi:hypothetical protein
MVGVAGFVPTPLTLLVPNILLLPSSSFVTLASPSSTLSASAAGEAEGASLLHVCRCLDCSDCRSQLPLSHAVAEEDPTHCHCPPCYLLKN